MSSYQFFRLARLLLLVLLATVFLLLARGRPVSRRLRLLVLALLAVAALGFVNFGFFHPGRGHVHYWDAFHYFMGAKYLPELGYTRLYEATYVAGRELGAFDYVTHLRDLETYTLRDAISIDRSAVRSRFRPERWEAFKRDLTYWGPHINEWRGLLQDHGYNDPPPRALLLRGLLAWTAGRAGPARRDWQAALAAAERLGMRYEQVLALDMLGRHGEPGRRPAYRERAAALFQELGVRDLTSPEALAERLADPPPGR